MSNLAARINSVVGDMSSCDRVRIQWPSGVDVHGAPNEVYVGNVATTLAMALGGSTPASQVEFYHQLSRELLDTATIVRPLTPAQCPTSSRSR
ncbi:MAG: hypothetical protein J0M34_02505 [Alphaproteobacteria bacterium]|nr:hypothetical protein [Alphaproteobacteria bacterium]